MSLLVIHVNIFFKKRKTKKAAIRRKQIIIKVYDWIYKITTELCWVYEIGLRWATFWGTFSTIFTHKYPNIVASSISLLISNPLPYDVIRGFMLGRTSLVPLHVAIDNDGGVGVRDRQKPSLSELGTAEVGMNYANSGFSIL